MNDFKKNNRFGGDRPGGDRGGFRRPGGDAGWPKEMFKAVCADCGKSCEVPFKPNGKKPVYCKECFVLHADDAPQNDGPRRDAPRGDFRRDDFQKREFPRRDFGPAHTAPFPRPMPHEANDRKIEDLRKQIDAVNSKLDRIVSILMPAPKPTEKAEPKAAEAAPAKPADKPAAKKAKANKK